MTYRCINCGNTERIEDLRSQGFLSCCPEREMRGRPPPKKSEEPKEIHGDGEITCATKP